MNTLVRSVSAAAVLGTAFFLAGCVTHDSRASRVKVVEEFTVVESSTEKELTPEQVADLRQAVANYLREQGLTDGRTYYVRVTFPSANPNEEPQWAVVRIGSQATRTYTVIAAYPGRDDYYPYDFYSTAYSSYYPGYYGFSRWGYYDPFDYNYGYYHPPVPPRNHGKPDKPDDKVDHPPGTRTRWDHTPRTDGDGSDGRTRWSHTPRTDGDNSGSQTRTADPHRWARERDQARDAQARSSTRTDRPDRTYTPPDRTSSPPPERTYTPPERNYTPPSPPPERSYSPPADNSGSRPEPSHGGIQQSREQER